MAGLAPVTRHALIARLRELGFEEPYTGGKHEFMVKGQLRLTHLGQRRGCCSPFGGRGLKLVEPWRSKPHGSPIIKSWRFVFLIAPVHLSYPA